MKENVRRNTSARSGVVDHEIGHIALMYFGEWQNCAISSGTSISHLGWITRPLNFTSHVYRDEKSIRFVAVNSHHRIAHRHKS